MSKILSRSVIVQSINSITRYVDIVKFVLSDLKGALGMILLLIPTIMALFPGLIALYDPWVPTGKPFEPPSIYHPLGTNDVGQDIFSELVYGARISLLVGVTSALLTVFIGLTFGVLAGYKRGVLDELIMAITDVMLLLPALPLMALLAVLLGPGYQNIVIVIALFSWPPVARMIRAQTLSVKENLYVEAARAIGASSLRIVLKYIIPQLIPMLIAHTILRVSGAMIAEASLSFLGLGDPRTKSWGSMIYWAQRSGAITAGAFWWIVAPGIMITITVLGLGLVGYKLEEWANPRLRR
jgi:peptide/nickel transport system permease protein